MTTLSTLLSSKYAAQATQGISELLSESTTAITFAEIGEIFTYTHHPAMSMSYPRCWIAPGNGTAIIEIWGAGGSGAGGCCCGTGGPANPGAYAKKTIAVAQNDWVQVSLGCSTQVSGSYCCAPQSGPTTVTICTALAGCECMCAQGGWGSCWSCGTSTSAFCCFANAGFYSGILLCGGCGIICHTCQACAYGGDINVSGGRTCVYYSSCNGSCISYDNQLYYIPFPPGIINERGGILTFTASTICGGNWSPSHANYNAAIRTLESQNSSHQSSGYLCWAGSVPCGCYEATSCATYLPPAFPGLGSLVGSGGRTVGSRGGPGAMRIRFIGS